VASTQYALTVATGVARVAAFCTGPVVVTPHVHGAERGRVPVAHRRSLEERERSTPVSGSRPSPRTPLNGRIVILKVRVTCHGRQALGVQGARENDFAHARVRILGDRDGHGAVPVLDSGLALHGNRKGVSILEPVTLPEMVQSPVPVLPSELRHRISVSRRLCTAPDIDTERYPVVMPGNDAGELAESPLSSQTSSMSGSTCSRREEHDIREVQNYPAIVASSVAVVALHQNRWRVCRKKTNGLHPTLPNRKDPLGMLMLLSPKVRMDANSGRIWKTARLVGTLSGRSSDLQAVGDTFPVFDG